jgi:hypothetical protein
MEDFALQARTTQPPSNLEPSQSRSGSTEVSIV